MPANRNKKFEKAKDFKSAIKRLLKELNPFKALVILSLTLSVAASILSIVTPNILSKLTDKISNGIVPNKENLVRINNEISSNFASGNAKDIEIDGVVISTIEQSEYLNVIKDIDKNAKVNELYSKIGEFPDTIKSLIKPSMDLSGITRISVFIGCLYLISAIFNYIEYYSGYQEWILGGVLFLTVVLTLQGRVMEKLLFVQISSVITGTTGVLFTVLF